MKILKILWFVVNIMIIVYFSYLHYTIDKDAVIPFVYLITFPSGFLIPYLYMFSSYLNTFSIKNALYISDIIIPGILFMIIGYIQWFILLPKIKKDFKSKKEKRKN